MSSNQESFNTDLYKLLRTRGYKPVPKDVKNQNTQPESAEVFKFTFTKDGKDYGEAWVTIDGTQKVILYYNNEQEESPSGKSSGLDYDDSWSGLKRHLKQWSMNKQLTFELRNKDELGDDMAQRDYVKKKEKLGEAYHPMGKTASYNDNIPSVKIILQHNRKIEEGEQRYRNVAKIFLENQDGERFLAPTTRPGIAQIYARHIAEGGVPNDERWNHVKAICEEYSKMAGFVRATKNNQFNESVQSLVNEGVNHYQSLRETLGKLRGHRGYNQYFESWTPALMEDETDGSQINELFVQETVDPRIASVMPILSRLHKKIGETSVKEAKELEQWADSIVEGDNGEEYDTATLQKMFGPETAHDAASHKPAMMNRKDNTGKTHSLVKLPNGNYRSSDVDDGEETLEEDSSDNPVENAIIRRIVNVRTDLLKHGPVKVLDAIKEVASYVGDVDEIGSSDVSGWIRHVEEILGNEPVDESDDQRPDMVDQLKSELRKSKKQQNATRSYYYAGLLKNVPAAAVSFEKFINSWAGENWFNRNEMKIEAYAEEQNRRFQTNFKVVYPKSLGEGDCGVDEDLDADQKRVGQLGPTEKVGKAGAVGKLVGACESVEDIEESTKEYTSCKTCKGDGADKDGNVCEKCLGTGDDESDEIKEGQEDLDVIKRLVK